MTYGTGTRSYNRSAEARELKRQREAATKKHNAEVAAGKRETVIVGPMCHCAAFNYAHEALAHERCLTSREAGALNAWLKSNQPSYLWEGWAGLGTEIKYRRMGA